MGRTGPSESQPAGDRGITTSVLPDELFYRPPKPAAMNEPVWLEAFLYHLANVGSVVAACRILQNQGVDAHPVTIWRWRKKDPLFDQQINDARAVAGDKLRDEAYRRAYEGYEKPVYQGGKLVGTIREFSDILLIFLLKQHDPSFRDRNYNMNLNLTPEQARDLTDEKIEEELKRRGIDPGSLQ